MIETEVNTAVIINRKKDSERNNLGIKIVQNVIITSIQSGIITVFR